MCKIKKIVTGDDMKNEIQKYKDFDTLYELWESLCVKGEENDFWHSGKAFEYIILRAFELESADVAYPYSVRNDEGVELEQIDGAIYTNGLSILCECKDYTRDKLNIEPISKMRNQLLRRPTGVVGCLFSMTSYSEATLILSTYISQQTILLWEQKEIDYCFQHKNFTTALIAKYRYAVEYGLYHTDCTLLLK